LWVESRSILAPLEAAGGCEIRSAQAESEGVTLSRGTVLAERLLKESMLKARGSSLAASSSGFIASPGSVFNSYAT